jgi:serine/threonine protein kinase/tetratricopeptide (TPR) repeat protein
MADVGEIDRADSAVTRGERALEEARADSGEVRRKDERARRSAARHERGATADDYIVEAEGVFVPVADSAPPSIPSAAELDAHESEGRISDAGDDLAPVLPGHVIADRYEVVSVLGEGGMGIVYRCRDLPTGHFVAIKRVIPPEGKLAAEYVMWFYKEARALAALDHPSIVHARDFGQLVDGSPFLVMDLVGGSSLHELAQTPLAFPLIWVVTDEILRALAHAHARGIIHGDLKPSNVLVEEVSDQPPKVRILDFGLAWLKQDPHDERLDGAKAMEFAPHAGAGTPGYMAPEQIQHEMHHVVGATDLYALGCILYKLFSGHAPFSGESKELLRQHAFEPPRPFTLAIDAPADVVGFVMRLLAKYPWDRWEFAEEARQEWGKWRPAADVDPSVWRFPTVPRRTRGEEAKTRKTGARGANPDLALAPERAPGLLSIRPSPLCGRDDVRRLLREVCDEVIEAQGAPHRLVILVGPAGVGKSRIAEWLCEVVHEEGTMIPLRARYRALRSPLDGMLGAVTQYFNFERADRETIERSLLARWKVAASDKNARTWVAGAAEWLRPVGPMSDQPLGPTGIRFALDTLETRRLVIRYTLRKVSQGRPLLFWLDDLHHATQATIDGLLRIHREEPDVRIVMVATVRSEDVELGTPVADRLRALREALKGAVVDVQPMDSDNTCALLRAALPLEDAAVTEAARRSRGNPLFALQQLHAWALAGNMQLVNGMYRVPPEVLSVRPQTTAELWDSRVKAMPEPHRLSAFAVATLGGDVRRNVLHALLTSLKLPADAAIMSLQTAEIMLPRGPGRYAWPHQLLQEHLLARLMERDDHRRIFRLSADALRQHPQASTRRVVRQRVANLLNAAEPDAAAHLFFDYLHQAWNGAREPRVTLADLELLKGHLQGRSLALKHRWQAEALRHVGRTDEARTHAEIARASFEELVDQENLAHCLRLLGHIASERGSSAEGLTLVNQAHDSFVKLAHISGQAQCEAVAGEIEYLLGNYERARMIIRAGEGHFATLGQPLGRGQCLLLLSWIEHSEGVTERSRRLALDARAEFEKAGYRLGIAQADASLAHVEHRLMNFFAAERIAGEALTIFQALRTPRGQAACERLLAMIAFDTDDLDTAEIHAAEGRKIYEELGDPWGILESKLLDCQIALARSQLAPARKLLTGCSLIRVEEAEPRQHCLLTSAWLEISSGDADKALEALEAASEVFGRRSRCGDHTPHLLARLSRLNWPAHAQNRLDAWRALLSDRARRGQV